MPLSPHMKLTQLDAFTDALLRATEAQNEIHKIGLMVAEPQAANRIQALLLEQDQALEDMILSGAHLTTARVFEALREALAADCRAVA